MDNFAKLALTVKICFDQPPLIALHRDSFPLFRIHIRKIAVGFKSKIRSLRTRLVTLNCILSHRDRGRSSRERGLQASPRPFLGLFLGLFFFLSFDTTPCSESGSRASSPLSRATDFLIRIYSCGTAPRHSERRTSFFDLPFLISAILLLVAHFHSDKLFFYRIFAAQRFVRHLCISKAGTFLSIHFSIFFSRNDISGQCLRGAEGESSPQSPPAGAFLQKKRRKRKKLDGWFSAVSKPILPINTHFAFFRST